MLEQSRKGKRSRLSELRQAIAPAQTADDIARKVGCSDSQIRKLENGFKNPGIVLARKVAAALGVTLDEAFPPSKARR